MNDNSNVIRFPPQRIEDAAFERYIAAREAWESKERAEDILAGMKGYPIPSLGNKGIYDLTQTDFRELAMDFIERLIDMIEEKMK